MADEPKRESAAESGAGDPLIGKSIAGRYVVEAIVDTTGEAIVYRARHTILGKRVAVKWLPASGSSPASVDSFLERAKLAASLGGPHVNRISDFGQTTEGTYVVMDWLDGVPLSKVAREGDPIALEKLLDFLRQIARALGAAHAKGVMHGRLDLRHVLVVTQGAEERIKVLGFGEPLGGESDAARTDIRALGLLLLDLADSASFETVAPFAVRKQREPVLDAGLGDKIAKLPAALQAIALKAVDRQGSKSYRRVEDMAEDLERMRRGEIPDALLEMIASGSWALLPESRDQGTAKRVAALLEPPRAASPPVKTSPGRAAVQAPRTKPKYAVLIALLVIGGLLAGWFGAGWLAHDEATTTSEQQAVAMDLRPFGPDE